MIYLRRIWQHAGELDAIHLMVTSGDIQPIKTQEAQRHIKLKRSSNPALYDFIREHASAVPQDERPDNDPETMDIS